MTSQAKRLGPTEMTEITEIDFLTEMEYLSQMTQILLRKRRFRPARQLRNISRVPAYQNLKFFGGFCEKFFKSLPTIGEDLGVVRSPLG